MAVMEDQLLSRGCFPSQAGRLGEYFDELGDSAVRLFVPGRIELIGNHVDYAGGSSLTIATTRGLAVVASPIAARELRIEVSLRGQGGEAKRLTARLGLEPELEATGWQSYPATLIRRILANVPGSRAGGGASIRIISDLPLAAGLSSSSAFLIALFLGWGHATGWMRDPALQEALTDKQAIADYVATIENGRDYKSLAGRLGVGTIGGSQDHTAIIQSRAGQIGRYRYVNPLVEGRWDWPEGTRPVVLTSGVEAEKTGAAQADYNRAAELAAELAALWTREVEPVEAIGQLTEAQLTRLSTMATGASARRLAAFVEECEAVDQATEALEAGRIEQLAAAANKSQWVKETLLQNQVPETSLLCELAKDHGALGATSFGAGFGGAVWALVESPWTPPVELLEAYRTTTGREAAVIMEQPGPGAFLLDGASLLSV